MTTETDRLQLEYLDPSQAQPEVKINDAWDKLEARLGLAGPRIAYASAAGSINNVAPAGFGAATGRLVVTLGSGDATWTGLAAGIDGQILFLRNADAANTLTLAAASASSSAANRFEGQGDTALPPGASLRLVYDATDARWAIG